MKHALKLMVLLAGLLAMPPAHASTIARDIETQLPVARKVGAVQVRFLGVRLYTASLFTQQGTPFDWSRPFALELTYARGFDRNSLVTASIKELERLEGARADHADIAEKLQACYRPVQVSDRFVAIPRGRDSLSFFFNGQETCRILHPDIRNRFLGIWLSDKARDVRLSRALRGLN